MLQVHRGKLRPLFEVFSSVTQVLFRFLAAELSEADISSCSKVVVADRSRHESKKLAGTSNTERCRFSMGLTVVAATVAVVSGCVAMALTIEVLPDSPCG